DVPEIEWKLPSITLLDTVTARRERMADEIKRNVKIIESTLQTFGVECKVVGVNPGPAVTQFEVDRKSTRLNSSHRTISYAVFCFGDHPDLPSFPTRRSSDLTSRRSNGSCPPSHSSTPSPRVVNGWPTRSSATSRSSRAPCRHSASSAR